MIRLSPNPRPAGCARRHREYAHAVPYVPWETECQFCVGELAEMSNSGPTGLDQDRLGGDPGKATGPGAMTAAKTRLKLTSCWSEHADAPDGAGASRDGWSGVRTLSAIGREGEPIVDVGMIGCGARWAKDPFGPSRGPIRTRGAGAPST
jgi:hypothetical protein